MSALRERCFIGKVVIGGIVMIKTIQKSDSCSDVMDGRPL